MSVPIIENAILKKKYQGSLLGSLVGDCMGQPYQFGMRINSKPNLQQYFDTLENPNLTRNLYTYTDDTAMMKSVAKFLIDKPVPDYKYLAELFTHEYFKEPDRGYAFGVLTVFHKLKDENFAEVFQPATEQFMGSGSYGNGGAMRIAPVALYFYDNQEMMIKVATEVTKITHTNPLGINGAILQCLAIQQALLLDPKCKVDSGEFCQTLFDKMRQLESTVTVDEKEDNIPMNEMYQEKLKMVQSFLKEPYTDSLDLKVIRSLGNEEGAHQSVPTAIYCFLRAQSVIPGIETDNIYRRTIQYAISLGGDTDTIACMAGAIAGAYLGEDAINSNMVQQCESSREILETADKLLMTKTYEALLYRTVFGKV